MKKDTQCAKVDLTSRFGDFPQVKAMFYPSDFDLRTFIKANVPVVGGAAVAALLWPGFTDYRSGVYLDFLFNAEGVDRWMKVKNGSVQAVEQVTNHLHLWDVFGVDNNADERELENLGKTMQATWRAALREAYPKREFDIYFADREADYGPTLSFSSVL